MPQAMAQIVLKIEKIVPYHGANPNNRNGARLRSPSPIMAPGFDYVSPEKSCFVEGLVCFISLCVRGFEFLNATRRE